MNKQKNTYEYQKHRGITRKLHLIDLRGGGCEKCGYNKNLSALDFHHLDPTGKESQLDARKLSNSTMKWIMTEFEKCQVLCANCHREEHSPELLIANIRTQVSDKAEGKITRVAEQGKPKCLDCGEEINYTYVRCNPCASKAKRKVERPDLLLLTQEVANSGYAEAGRKYNVSPKSIKRWLERGIE